MSVYSAFLRRSMTLSSVSLSWNWRSDLDLPRFWPTAPPADMAMTEFTTDWNVSPDVNAPIPRKMNTNSSSKIINRDTNSSANSCVLHKQTSTHTKKTQIQIHSNSTPRAQADVQHIPQAHGLQHFVTHSILELLHCLFEPASSHHPSVSAPLQSKVCGSVRQEARGGSRAEQSTYSSCPMVPSPRSTSEKIRSATL